MAQDYQLPADQADSQTAFLNKVNEAAESQRSSFLGSTAPTDPAPYEGQLWMDSGSHLLYVNTSALGATWSRVSILSPVYNEGLVYVNAFGISSTIPQNAGQVLVGTTLTTAPVVGGLADISGTLPVAKGGIGLATATAGDMLTYVSGTAYAAIPKGTANQILGMNNGATTQEYKTVTAGTGIGVSHGANSITIAADAAVTRWVKYSKAHGDFNEAGLGVAETVTLAALPARTIVSSAVIKTVTAFSGGGLASLDASVGITGNTTAIIGTYDAFAAAGDNNFSGGAGSLYYAGTNLTLTLTPDGAANLAGMNAGSIEVWIETATLPA